LPENLSFPAVEMSSRVRTNKKLSYRRETARQLRNVYLGWLTDSAVHRTPQAIVNSHQL